MNERRINHAVKAGIEQRLKSGELDLARDGGWWCNTCPGVTELNCDGPQNVCGICGSALIKPCPAIGEPLSRLAGSFRDSARPVPVAKAHSLFEAMRNSL